MRAQSPPPHEDISGVASAGSEASYEYELNKRVFKSNISFRWCEKSFKLRGKRIWTTETWLFWFEYEAKRINK